MQENLSFIFGSAYHLAQGIQRWHKENCITSEGFRQFGLIFLRISRTVLGVQYLGSFGEVKIYVRFHSFYSC